MPGYSRNDVKVLKKFGSVIKARRDDLDISQEELAERAKLHRTYVGGIEQGRRNLSLLNIIKLSEALDLAPEDIFRQMNLKE